jgi:hypothetical protein
MAARGRPVTEVNLRQVRAPRGARIHPNQAGLAPGFEVELAGVPVVCLPGVPREVYAIFDGSVAARVGELAAAAGAPAIARAIYRVFGRSESQVSEALRGMVDAVPGATIHYQVKFPETLVKLVVSDPDRGVAEAGLGPARRRGPRSPRPMDLRHRRGRPACGGRGPPRRRRPHGRGRRVVHRRTPRRAPDRGPGRVAVLPRWRHRLRQRREGARPRRAGRGAARARRRQRGLRDRHGRGDPRRHRRRARGSRSRAWRGPTAAPPTSRVGTVWLALAQVGRAPTTFTFRWPGARDQVRTLAAWWALALLRDAVEGAP